jgi:hypothetical protein
VAGGAPLEYGLGFELYEMLPDAILAVDQRGVIRYANRQAGVLFGQAPATLVATPWRANCCAKYDKLGQLAPYFVRGS